jgi:F420H(2)-dependent quinone reductase
MKLPSTAHTSRAWRTHELTADFRRARLPRARSVGMSRRLSVRAGGAASGAPTPLGDLALRMPKLTRRITAVHGALFVRAQSGPLARWFGASILVLETVGRRTGRLRATPLAYLSHGDDLVVVPANAGADLAPAWWLNLQTAGHGVAILDNQRRSVRPRIAADTEHQQLWQRLATVAPIDHYQRRTRRPLPIVVLEPIGIAPAGRSATRTPTAGSRPPRAPTADRACRATPPPASTSAPPSTASLPAQASPFAGLQEQLCDQEARTARPAPSSERSPLTTFLPIERLHR